MSLPGKSTVHHLFSLPLLPPRLWQPLLFNVSSLAFLVVGIIQYTPFSSQEDPQGGNGSSPGGGGAESMLKWGPGLWGGFREVRPFHPPTPHPPTPATRAYRRCIFLWARSSLCLGASSCPAPLLWVSGLRGLWWPWLRRVWSGTLRPPPACGPHNFCSDEPGLWGCWGRWEGSLQAP